MMALAIHWRLRPDNPVKGIERNVEHKRKRYLSGDELARLTEALTAHGDREAADVIGLLLLTGCRRGEALAARWAAKASDKWRQFGPSGAKLKEGAMSHSLVGRQMGRWRVVRYVGVTGVSHALRRHWYECVM